MIDHLRAINIDHAEIWQTAAYKSNWAIMNNFDPFDYTIIMQSSSIRLSTTCKYIKHANQNQ